MRLFSFRPTTVLILSYAITGSIAKCHNDILGLKLVYLWIFKDVFVIFNVYIKFMNMQIS